MKPALVTLRRVVWLVGLFVFSWPGLRGAGSFDGVVPPHRLAAWLHARNATVDQPIVFLGFRPAVAAGLATRVKIVGPAKNGDVNPAHSAAIAWVAATLPQARVVCVPWAGQLTDADLAKALRVVQSERPAVVYLPAAAAALLDAPESASRGALVEGWDQEVLFLTVVGNQLPQRSTPAGVLPVYLWDAAAPGERPAKAEAIGRAGIMLPASLFAGPDARDRAATVAHAAAYVAVVAAALPVRGPSKHVERAARLALTGASVDGPDRSLDVLRAFEPAATSFIFGGKRFAWNDRAGEVETARAVLEMTPRSGARDTVVTGVAAQTPMRCLAAAALLADAEPTFFLPQKLQSIVSLRPRLPQSPLKGEPTRVLNELLATQKATSEGGGLFNAVARDPIRSGQRRAEPEPRAVPAKP